MHASFTVPPPASLKIELNTDSENPRARFSTVVLIRNTAHWEHLPHRADITICGFGRSKAEAFEQAAIALTVIVTKPDAVAALEAVEIACNATS